MSSSMHELVDASWATAFSTSSNGGCAATCFDKLSMTLGHWGTVSRDLHDNAICMTMRSADNAIRVMLRRQ
jgi:hypothetical protein